MTIAILTMSQGINYGNRLQNYATQRTLEKLNFQVETIQNFTGQTIEYRSKLKQKLRYIVSDLYIKIPIIKLKKMNYILRETKFEIFNKNYINHTKYTITKENVLKNINKMYDFYVCGSDQVWNPEFNINSEIDFLTFANKGQRIAYAPSFGISELPSKCIEDYKKWINGIDYLSVREQAGADIIKKLTGRDALVLVDPTLMLNKEEWLSISKMPKLKLYKKYILTYFLGNKSKAMETKINNIAQKYNLEIINLLDINDKYGYSVDPSEFIWLINNCELVCTDSFHGSVFSLIMEKAFMVFERKDELTSMNSRLDTLLKKFNMKNRKEENIVGEDEIFNVDFSKVDEIIKYEKEKSLNYLRNALGVDK